MRKLGSGMPKRLFVAGLHGDEWKDTTDILTSLAPPKIGSLFIISKVSDGAYISTLKSEYYKKDGKKIIESVKKVNPDVYIELHAYNKEHLKDLTDDKRFSKRGVPPYIELEGGVLIGSVSPHIAKYFPMDRLCLSFEIQKGDERSRRILLELLEILKDAEVNEFLIDLFKRYPNPVRDATIAYFRYHELVIR
ncbi:MAG: hypothetical protein MASP_00063 [Candidatus Methanolliviera sp. GoM_asphalt]|nr:MAG: hypothetical protein MASP_00063 [Candidatus Methanolliviera sp. GoM_asphalt]